MGRIYLKCTYWKPPKHEVVRENILESIEKKSVSIGNFCLFCILYNPIKMRKEKKEEKKRHTYSSHLLSASN